MLKNVQTTAQLDLFRILARSCSKSSKPGFNNMWTENFQMFKLDLEKVKEPEIKLPTSIGSLKKQESSRETSTSALLTTSKPLTLWIITNWKILKEMGIPDHLTYLLRNVYAGQEATVRTGHGTTDWFQIGKGVHQGCILSPCLFILCRVHHEKHWTGKDQFSSWSQTGNSKECSNYCTIALITHASKVMLKILQARLQQYVNCELTDAQAGFRKDRGTREQIANIHWTIEKAREFQKNIYFCFIDYAKAFDCVDHNKLENSERDGNTRPPDLPLEKPICRSGSNS